MRSVDLLEDASDIFTATVNRSLYTFYRSHLKQFASMISEQGVGYWIKFCTTLKTVLEKEGYNVHYFETDIDYFDDVFMDLVTTLGCNNPDAVKNLIQDIISISRFSQLYRALRLYGDMEEGVQDTAAEAVKALCGEDSGEPTNLRLWCSLPIYLRAVGSILKIFQLWNNAKPAEKIKWIAPEKWRTPDKTMPGQYEMRLKRLWKWKLCTLLDIEESDIHWWNAEKVSKYNGSSAHRISNLGQLIKKIGDMTSADMVSCLKVFLGCFNNAASCNEAGKNLNKIQIYSIVRNLPKGGILFIGREYYRLLFVAACCREFYVTSSSEAFHPYSEFLFGFWNKCFGPTFWRTLSSEYRGNIQIGFGTVEYIRPFMFVNDARAAMYFNSRFHDSIASGITWESPETLVRLMWNMPLCLNWLEILLLKVYEFECHFLPFLHFPLGENVVHVAEEVYMKYCKTARFLVKSALIVAEYIYMNEDKTPGRCYDARIALKFALSCLVPKMKFLSGPCYQILEVIRSEESTHIRSSKVAYPNLDLPCSLPDIDRAFNSDRRSVNYWLARRKQFPSLEESLRFFPDCLQALQNYEKEVKQKQNSHEKKKPKKQFYNYDEKVYLDVCTESLKLKPPNCLKDEVSFVIDVFDLLAEDNLKLRENRIFLEKIKSFLSSEMTESDSTGKVQQIVSNLAHLGRVYLVCACLVGDGVSPPNQILLTQLLNAECRATMADVGNRFVASWCHLLLPETVPHPLSVFMLRTDMLTKFHLKQIELSDAVELLAASDYYYTINTELVTPFKVPHLKTIGSKIIDVYKRLAEDLLKFRYRLIYEVSEKQWEHSLRESSLRTPTNNTLFPHLNLVECSFVEEVAALRKCVELGEDHEATLERLSDLLLYRAKWLLKEFKTWSELDISAATKTKDGSISLHDIGAQYCTQTAVLAANKESIFEIYLSDLNTVHPMHQSTEDVIVGWQVYNFLYSKVPNMRSIKDDLLVDYYDALKKMGIDYLSKMFDQCISLWNIPKLCTKPNQKVEKFGRQHAEKVYTALQHFMLFCGYYLMSSMRKKSGGLKVTFLITAGLGDVEKSLRLAAVNPFVDWNRMCIGMKNHFRNIIDLIHMCAKEISLTGSHKPSWKGCIEAYHLLFLYFIENDHEKIKCLGIEEFLCHQFGAEDNVQKSEKCFLERVMETKEISGITLGRTEEKKTDCNIGVDTSSTGPCESQKKSPKKKKKKEGRDVEDITKKLSTLTVENNKHTKTEKSVDREENRKCETSTGMKTKKMNNDGSVKKPTICTKNSNINIRLRTKANEDKVLLNQPNKSSKESMSVIKGVNDAGNVEKVGSSERRRVAGGSSSELENGMEVNNIENCEPVRGAVSKLTNGLVIKLRKCSTCGNTEPERHTYKKCSLCAKHKWKIQRFYCSAECQVKDWKERHRQEHKNSIAPSCSATSEPSPTE